MFRSCSFLVIFFVFFALVSCQISSFGKFNSAARQIYFGKRADSGMNDSKFRIEVPFHDSKVLLRAAEEEEQQQQISSDDQSSKSESFYSSPFSFAKAIPVEIDSRTNGIWEEDSSLGIRTWSIFIESKTALSIAMIFDEFRIFDEGELYVINDSKVLGAFTRSNNKPDGKFSIQHLKGSSVFLIYIEPFKSVKPLNRLKISKIVHAFRDAKSLSGSCNVDSRCVSQFVRQDVHIL